MLRHLHREPGFYKRLFYLALPLILQNLITTSLGFVDTFMVGMLGQNELSAVTAANTPIYMLQIIILGLLSGLSVLASQYWGKGDTESINRCMGVSLYAGLIIAVSVAVVLFFFPLQVMALVTNNGLLIELGAPYLRIVGLSYIFNTISSVYIGMQRSTENPAMGMIVFGISMLTNTCLNYILIFGKLGAPALGITGAAIATLISRVVEVVMVLCYAPHYHRVPLMPRLLLRPGRAMVHSFLKYATPVLVNEVPNLQVKVVQRIGLHQIDVSVPNGHIALGVHGAEIPQGDGVGLVVVQGQIDGAHGGVQAIHPQILGIFNDEGDAELFKQGEKVADFLLIHGKGGILVVGPSLLLPVEGQRLAVIFPGEGLDAVRGQFQNNFIAGADGFLVGFIPAYGKGNHTGQG